MVVDTSPTYRKVAMMVGEVARLDHKDSDRQDLTQLTVFLQIAADQMKALNQAACDPQQPLTTESFLRLIDWFPIGIGRQLWLVLRM